MSKGRSFMSALSDSLETAAGWAIAAILLYAIVFMDITGNGSLWSAARGLTEDKLKEKSFQVVTPASKEERGSAILVAGGLTAPVPEPAKAALAPAAAPPAPARPEAAMTDSPADPDAAQGDSWKPKLKGDLRKFTVYGKGEQRSVTSAAPSGGVSAGAAAYSKPAGFPAAVDSPASRSAGARARPGLSTRVQSSSDGGSSVRNLKKR